MDKAISSSSCSVPFLERNRNIKSVLDVEVSCFQNYATPSNPATMNLLTWLTSGKYRKEVEQLRATEDKTERDWLKSKLPAITPSGVFSFRSESNLIRHSVLLQFDIDLKENRQIGTYHQLKEQIGNIPNVAYCGLSVSGRGFWGLIPIVYSERHRQHFEALRQAFLRLGITIDVKPKNVSSLRGYSYDPNPYFDHQAANFVRYELPVKNKLTPNYTFKISKFNASPIRERVEAIISKIERSGLDITSSYASWFEIGCSIANEFGENGRDYFHRISQQYPNYSSDESNR